jgi:ABC-type nitrate/sulfonate/bicarbonate transport system substrate-binding protein
MKMPQQRPLDCVTRRSFALGSLAAALAAPNVLRAQAMTKVRITQPADSLTYMPVYVARAKDLFREAGLDVQVVVTRGDGPDVQALMAKEVEFVATPPHHLYTLFLQNRKLLGVCGILGRCGINLVVSKDAAAERGVTEHSPIEKKLQSLKGLTIGASAPGSLTYNIAQYYIQRAGYNPQTDAKVVASGTGAAAIAAMKNKIVNAYTFSSPLTDELVNLGIADWLINNTRGQDPELKEFLHAVIYVRPDYLNENTALVKRMIGALVKAATWIRSTPVEEVAKVARPFFASLDEKVYTSALANVREAVIPDGRMTAAGSDAYQKVLLQTGHLKERVAFDSVFTNQYLPG